MGEYAKDVLVSTDWVEEHRSDANVVVVEVDEDTEAYGRGHIPGAIAWNWRSDLQDPLRRDFISKDGLVRAALPRRHRRRHADRPVRREQQLVRRVRVLVPAVLRPHEREAHGRRPQEVGARGTRADRRRRRASEDDVHGEGAEHEDPRVPRRRPRRDRQAEPRRRPVAAGVRRRAARAAAPAAGVGDGAGTRPDREEHPVVEDRPRGRRHVQARRGAARSSTAKRAST